MKTFLLFLLIGKVSGDEKSVISFLNENVLLPCTCENRTLSKEWKWQMEKENVPKQLVWSSKNTTNFSGRVETFSNNNTYNCSILLKNVTEDDQGKYRCCLYNPAYQYQVVNLWVCGSGSCQQNFTQRNGVFKCDVNSSDSATILQWTLNGKSLENSPNYKISNNSTRKDGIFHITSTLENLTEIDSSSELICNATRLTPSSVRTIIKDRSDTTVNTNALVVVLVLVAGLAVLVVFKLLQKRQKKKILSNFFPGRAIPEGNKDAI